MGDETFENGSFSSLEEINKFIKNTLLLWNGDVDPQHKLIKLLNNNLIDEAREEWKKITNEHWSVSQ